MIRGHIDGQTAWGKKLAATKRHLKLNIATQMKDDFDEQSYSAALFDYGLVMHLLKETIAEKRTDEQFVLLEGLFNSPKLDDVDAALENAALAPKGGLGTPSWASSRPPASTATWCTTSTACR